jgi:secreted trypsin-like serine protease
LLHQLKYKRTSLFAALILFSAFISLPISHASRNGVEEPKNTFAVGITFKTTSGLSDLCSGALISPTFIVTAAHCVTDTSGNKYSDYIFSAPGVKLDDPINPASQPQILEVTVPDGYYKEASAEQNDIAFIKLDRALANKGFIRIATDLEVAGLEENTILRGHGFGAVFETGATYSNVPREYILNWSKKDLGQLQTFQLSSATAVGCSGDSGGPITATLKSGEEVLIATLHGAAFVQNRCGTPAPDGLFYMQVSLVGSFVSLVSADLQKSLILPTPSPTVTSSPTAKPKIYKITCAKGKTKKYISGTKPKCPTGYKQTAKVLISK